MSNSDLTPLMRQFCEIKEAHKDAIVFFRVGDFYEMFFQDAEEAAGILNIALTSRDKNSPHPVPLCGVPYHAASNYIATLLKHGKTVALCEQVEDPKQAKGLVRREVVRIYTPGTLIDPELLSAHESNFLIALACRKTSQDHSYFIGLASLDLSTGEFFLSDFSGPHAPDDVLDELIRTGPRELILPVGQGGAWSHIPSKLHTALAALKIPSVQADSVVSGSLEENLSCLVRQFKVLTIHDLGLHPEHQSIHAAAMVLRYIHQTQPLFHHDHIQRPQIRHATQEMHLDAMTLKNLEILSPMAPDQKNATLLSVLDHTLTAMGSRLLRHWLVRPLLDVQAINRRLDAVQVLTSEMKCRMAVRQSLKGLADLERISSRIALEMATPRDLLHLKASLEILPQLQEFLKGLQCELFLDCMQRWDNLRDVVEHIDQAISPDAPNTIKDGAIIREGYDDDVDALRRTTKEGHRWLADLEQRERIQTGIDSLKIKFNQVFGYYFEVTKPNLPRVPSHFIRKQTMANAERFTSHDLRNLEEEISSASTKLRLLEQELFQRIRQQIGKETLRLQGMAKTIGVVDTLATFAEISSQHRYTRPTVHEGGVIHIKEGRHPVLERLLLPDGFIANDALLDLEGNRLLLITGPNMAGKSTYLRQTGLIVLLAHIGCFVPAEKAHIGLVDRIFTRVGASDNLAGGQSTFMVEMAETARILEASTPRSLILLDEIGRGTSTYDGLSLAWSIAEYIQDRSVLGARTLFATHYHEMTDLDHHRSGVKNYTIAVKETNDSIVFLRKIIPGKADKSYGIHVAKLAGIPKRIILRAQEVLSQLEQPESSNNPLVSQHQSFDTTIPLPHPIIEEVKQMDLFTMTPLEAMNRLAELQKKIE